MRSALPLLQSLLLLAFVLTRAVVPVGFMPSGQGAWGFDWCPAKSAAVVELFHESAWGKSAHAPHGAHANHHHHSASSDTTELTSSDCDFAWLVALLTTPELALSLLVLALLALSQFKRSIYLRTRFSLPLARAPPHI